MNVGPEESDLDQLDPAEYVKLQIEIDEKHAEFMGKHLRRLWPKRVVRLVGVFQILLSLAVLAVDLPIVLMYAPRWQVFAGCWTCLIGLIAGVSAIRATGETTWLKLKWNLALAVLCGLAAAVMMSFDILMTINPGICVNIGGCNYLKYTHAAAKPYYMAQTLLGAGLLITVAIIIALFVKYGLGGSSLFDDIQRGWAERLYKPMMEPYEPPMEMQPLMPQQPPISMYGMMPPGPMRMPMHMGPMVGPGAMYMSPLPQAPPRHMMIPRPHVPPPMIAGPLGLQSMVPGFRMGAPAFPQRSGGPLPGMPPVG